MRKAAAYIRRSTDRQDTSLADQLHAITQYSEKNGFEIVDIYKDDAVSGTSTDGRLAFQTMMAAVEKSSGKPPFQAILTWDVKRFSRGNIDEAGYFRHVLSQKGVEVIYITENFKGDDTDDLILNTKQWLARQESKDKSRDTIRGQLSRIQAGYSANSAHPYGYYRAIIDKDGNVLATLKKGQKSRKSPEERVKLVPGEPQEIAIVREIYDTYVNRSMGKWSIARMLNQRGVSPPRGGQKKTGWGTCSVDFILKNQAYIGALVYNKTTRGKFSGIQKQSDGGFTFRDRSKIDAGKTKRNDESEWMIISNTHEAIISKDLFEKAQQVRKERFVTGGLKGRPSSEYLWTGLIRCEVCGRGMCGYTQRGVNAKQFYYSCPGCVLIGNPKRPTPAKALDEYILNRIQQRVKHPSRIKGVINALDVMLKKRVGDIDARRSEIQTKLSQNEEKINNLLDSIDPRNKDLINKRLDELREEGINLEKESADLESRAPLMNTKAMAEELSQHVHRFREVFKRGTMAERKAFARTFVASITVNPPSRAVTVGLYRLPKIGVLSYQDTIHDMGYSGTITDQFLQIEYETFNYKTGQLVETLQ